MVRAPGRMAVLLAVGTLFAWSQGTQTASVMGSVIDAEGAEIAGALVRLTSPSLQGARTVSTDGKGRFMAHLLPPGAYLLEITKDGYQTITLKERLGIAQNFQPRFRMARRQEAVVVVLAAPPAVDKTDVKTASNYSMDRMDLLPVDRSLEGVACLTPSVSSGLGGVLVRGAMTTNNLMLVDGQNVEDSFWGNRGVRLIDDAVEEMEIITGAIPAEYGNVDGGVLNAITRSGSNTFTGQVRWNFQRPSWNATGPLIDRKRVSHKLGDDLTFSLGGYLIEDRLWFFTSGFKERFEEVRTISSSAVPSTPEWPRGAGSTYMFSRHEERRQLKLTWLLSPEHTLVASYMGSENQEHNVDFTSGCLDTLVPQERSDLLLNLAWRALWSPWVTSDVRFGVKKQTLAGGASGSQSPILDDYYAGSGLFYNQGKYNAGDGGDHRDNRTFAAKVSFFPEDHQVDVGLDWLESSRRARNEPSTTGYIFNVTELDPVTRTAVPVDVWVYGSRGGETTVEHNALFLNDKWTLNERLALQLGLRWDRYEGRDEDRRPFAGASGWSPRLGVKWDIHGDSKWIAGASYARYNGKVLESILLGSTHQGNPQELDYVWVGPGGRLSYEDICDLSNYDFSADGCTFQYLPGVNVRMNRHLKAPGVDEWQSSLAYSFQDTPVGSGHVRATAVYKAWKNLLDYRVGDTGTVDYTLPSGDVVSSEIYLWDNNPDATRNYRALELDFSAGKDPWRVSGSLTWSRLWGNYQGEDGISVGMGEGLRAWNPYAGITFDRDIVAPEGDLRGNAPFRVRLMGTYTKRSFLGETTLGLLYRFDAGSRESETRSIDSALLNPALPPEAGYFTQYKDNKRGTNRGRSTWYLDVSVNHEWNLFRAKKTPVRAFLKALVKNVLNHRQLLRTPKTYEAAVTSPSDPWVPDAGYGIPGPADYGEPRTYSFSAGVRF